MSTGDPQKVSAPSTCPHPQCCLHPHRSESQLEGTSTVQGLRLPLGKLEGLREKHKLETGPRKAPGLQERSWMGQKKTPPPPRPRERRQGNTSCWHLCLKLCVERS